MPDPSMEEEQGLVRDHETDATNSCPHLHQDGRIPRCDDDDDESPAVAARNRHAHGEVVV